MVVLQRSPPLTRWAAKGHKPAILFASIDRAQIVTIRVDIVHRRSSTVPDCAYMSEQSTLLVFSSLWVSCWVMALLPPGGTTRQHIRGTQGDLRGHLTVKTGLFGVGQVYTLNKLHQIPGNPVEYSEILKILVFLLWKESRCKNGEALIVSRSSCEKQDLRNLFYEPALFCRRSIYLVVKIRHNFNAQTGFTKD